MVGPPSITRVSRAAALALLLATPALTIAYADDEYGTGHETVNRGASSAIAQPNIPPGTAQSWDYEHDRDAMIRSLSPSNQAGRVSSTVPMVDGKTDVVGAGGAQDQLGREIHHPGSGTD